MQSFIGGLSLDEDKGKCKNCQIAVGTPGRVKHLIRDGILKTNAIHLLILDEVDKLMESSFVSDINEIFNSLPDRKQIITTSATYSVELNNFLCKFMLSPTYVEVDTNSPLLLGLRQFVKIIKQHTSVVQEMKLKNEEILNLFSTISFTQCLIFTNYQTRAESICNFLNQRGWRSTYISAAQSQIQRLETVRNLKNFECKILLSTDLTARGIDAANVDLVINYDTPTSAVTYLHRMGRAGRYGSLGICIDLVPGGAGLCQWRNMIGLIGGCCLGIPELPTFSGSVCDLLKVEVPAEHYIFGTVHDTYPPESNQSIKKQMLHLKQRKKSVNASKEEGIELGKTKEEYGADLTEVNKEHAENLNYNKDINRSVLSNELQLDESDFLKYNNRNSNDTSVNNKDNFLGSHKTDLNCEGKESEIALDDATSNPMEVEENVYYKNKALLCVTQILAQKKFVELDSDLYALRRYIDMMKNNEKNEISKIMFHADFKPIMELLENINEVDFLHENDLDIEKIFKIGYRYATKSNSSHWSSYLSNSEMNTFKNLSLAEKKKNTGDMCETENIYEEDENNTNNEFSNINGNTGGPEITKWIPVEKSDSIAKCRKNSDWEHFNSYFNQSSEDLWRLGLCFESIEDFDDWFYETWQTRVFTVRDYVQQNIYVQEMSNYQESRYKRNK